MRDDIGTADRALAWEAVRAALRTHALSRPVATGVPWGGDDRAKGEWLAAYGAACRAHGAEREGLIERTLATFGTDAAAFARVAMTAP